MNALNIDPNLADELTPRQRQVAMLIGRGEPVEDIAKILHLSIHTVLSHKRGACKTLNIRGNRLQVLTAWSARYLPK